jgi:hypothetical protein
MTTETRFRSPWGAPLVTVTGLVVLLLLSVPGRILLTPEGRGAVLDSIPLFLIVLIMPLGILIYAAVFFFIRGYTITPRSLIVHRFAKAITYPLNKMQSVEINPTAMRWTCPMTNGGLFSFGGHQCRNKTLGWFRAYVTDFKRCVVLRFSNGTVVVTPENPETFVETIRDAQQLNAEATSKSAQSAASEASDA